MRRLLLFLLIPSLGFGDASLTFGGTTADRIVYADQASNRNMDPYTVIYWARATDMATVNRVIWGRSPTGADGSANRIQMFNSSGDTRFVQSFTTSHCLYITTGVYALNTWVYVAAVFNSAAGAGNRWKVYKGTLGSNATAQTMTVGAEGVGTITDQTGHAIQLGNRATDDVTFAQAFIGQIGFFAEWNRALSLSEIQDQQFTPHITSGCVLFSYPGFNGTGTQYDLTGNGANGTVTSAVVSALGPPITIGGGPQ